jgi:hypothetical protein
VELPAGNELELEIVTAEPWAAFNYYRGGLHSRAVSLTLGSLRAAGNNAALMLHEQGASSDEARAYLERWRLLPRERAEHAISFLTDPTWRAYSSTYILGRQICGAWVGDDLGRLARLLCEQIAVSELQAAGTPA